MSAITPRKTGTMEKQAIGTVIELVLILMVVCLLASIAGFFLLRPAIQPKVEETRALDMLLGSPVPAAPGETCGSLVMAVSRENNASAHWEVDHPDGLQPYLVTVNIQRGADTTVFHWTVDPDHQTISSLEERTICPLP
jgi:hypothetical protein